jgi:hypothetical protein
VEGRRERVPRPERPVEGDRIKPGPERDEGQRRQDEEHEPRGPQAIKVWPDGDQLVIERAEDEYGNGRNRHDDSGEELVLRGVPETVSRLPLGRGELADESDAVFAVRFRW